jgi:hypothetical protein
MSSSHPEDAELASLDWDWGEAYLICHPEPDVWVAQRRDDRATLRAAAPGELREAIRADYARRPVPRDGE